MNFEDLHRVGAALHATQLTLGQDDLITLFDETQTHEQIEDSLMQRRRIIGPNIEGHGIHTTIKRDTSTRPLMSRESVNRDVGT
jgi:hypothetical protein